MAKKSKKPVVGLPVEGDAFLWKEWDQTWEHARHLENARMRYLGFLFTAVFAVIAVLANSSEQLSLEDETFAAVLCAMVLALSVLSMFVLLTVERLNNVYRLYNDAIFEIRRRCSEEFPKSAGVGLWSTEKTPRGRVSTVSEWVPRTVFVACFAAVLIYSLAVVHTESAPDFSAAIGAATAVCILVVYAFGHWARSAAAI